MAESIIKGNQNTGWQNIINNGSLKYRVLNGVCFLRGQAINCTHNVSFATLPANIRPTQRWTARATFPLGKSIYVNIPSDGAIAAIMDGGGSTDQLYFTTSYPLG